MNIFSTRPFFRHESLLPKQGGQFRVFENHVRMLENGLKSWVPGPDVMLLTVGRSLASALSADARYGICESKVCVERPFCHSWVTFGRQEGDINNVQRRSKRGYDCCASAHSL